MGFQNELYVHMVVKLVLLADVNMSNNSQQKIIVN